MMRFIDDACGEITQMGYSTNNSQISLKFQYKSKAKGFLICVSNIFAPALDLENTVLLQKLSECVKKNGSSYVFKQETEEYSFFYADEEKIRVLESGLQLPSSVKSPAKINIYWIDNDYNAHIEAEKVREIIIPIVINAELKRHRKGLIKKEHFCDINLSCASVSNVEDGVVFYRIGGKEAIYPVTRRIIAGKQTIIIKTQDESTSIMLDLCPQYKKLYTLQIINS